MFSLKAMFKYVFLNSILFFQIIINYNTNKDKKKDTNKRCFQEACVANYPLDKIF